MELQTGIFSGLIDDARRTKIAQREAFEKYLAERRTSLENPQTPLSFPAEWLLDIFNGGRTDSGIRVSEMTALQVSDVFACVDIISSAIASQPLNVYERLEVGDKVKRHAKRMATDHPLFDLLRYCPNSEMTTFTFVKTLQAHMLLWGNGYAEIQRDDGGRVVALWPRNPSATRPRRTTNTGDLFYVTYDGMEGDIRPDGDQEFTGHPERAIKSRDMVHIPGLSIDGRMGRDVIQDARQLVGLYLAVEKHAAKFFGNGAIPGGVLTHPAKLKAEAAAALKRSWAEAQGGENTHRVAVLEEGLQYTKIGATPSEAQMIDARKTLRGEVAALFHVPVTMLGETGASRANAEQVALEFVNYTLAPWVSAWEHELKRKLFQPASMGRNAGRVYFARIDTRALTIPDAKSKQEYYSAGKQWGFLSTNDIRDFESLNPVEDGGGDDYWMPVNMAVAGETGSHQPSAISDQQSLGENETPEPKQQPQESVSIRAEALYYRQFRDAFGRVLARPDISGRAFERIFSPVVFSLAEFIVMSDSAHQPATELPRSAAECAREIISGLRENASVWEEPRADAQAMDELRGSIEMLRDAIEPRKKLGVLYIARHGETDDDANGLTSGTLDTPLNEQGKKDAAKLADYVANKLPVLTGIFAPDVQRHQQTAKAVAKSAMLPIHLDDSLGPWDIGELAGTKADGKVEQFKQSPGLAPPGGESMSAANQRTNAAIKFHAKQAAKTGPRLLIMSHRAVRAYESKVSGDDVTENLKTGGLVKFDGKEFEELI